MKFGNLEFVPALEHPELLAPAALEGLKRLADTGQVGVAEIDPTLSDTAAFCEKYQVGPEQAANCVVLKARKEGVESYIACVILATTCADVNGLVKDTVGIKKVSFAPMEEAVTQSSMEFGGITSV